MTTHCRWCGNLFDTSSGPGRPREYCNRSCRQRGYEARRQGNLCDRLCELEAAIEDIDRDLADDPTAVREALDWLLTAARPLAALRLNGGLGASSPPPSLF